MECQSDGIPVGRRATAGAERARGQGVRDLFGVRHRSLRHGCGAAAASGDGPECEEHAGTTLTAMTRRPRTVVAHRRGLAHHPTPDEGDRTMGTLSLAPPARPTLYSEA